MKASEDVQLSELVACLAMATDLGMGQPLEHCLRTCLLTVGIGQRLGLTEQQLADAYYIALLRFVGCNSHAHQDFIETGDEIAFRAGVAPVLNGATSDMLRFTLTRIGKGSPKAARAKMVAGALAAGSKGARQAIAATCEVAQMIAGRLGLSESVVHGLAYSYEHYDGKGFPAGAEGEEIPIAAHLAMMARDFEVLYRLGGKGLVIEEAARRRGRAYDPKLLDVFAEQAWELLEEPADQSAWDAVVALDPDPQALHGGRFGEALKCMADFSDMGSVYTHGYSHAVADLATQAAEAVTGAEPAELRAAALVQELGMTGVSNAVIEKPGRLTETEWERVRLHPYLTQRILARCAGLAFAGTLAAAHHERLDGGGYHRGLQGSQLSPSARLLAAAGAYAAMRSERAWRPAMASGEAATTLREMAAAGGLDSGAVDAVLSAAGETVSPRRTTWPAGLTDREVEVLQLIGQGLSNREVARRLVISAKTVGRHVENIYAKLGISTRAAAAVFALQHGLLPGP